MSELNPLEVQPGPVEAENGTANISMNINAPNGQPSAHSSDIEHIFDSDDEANNLEDDVDGAHEPDDAILEGIAGTGTLSDISLTSDEEDEPERNGRGHVSEEEYVQDAVETEPEEDEEEELSDNSGSDNDRPKRRLIRRNSGSRRRSEFAVAEENPDLYGLRRSGRARAPPSRLNVDYRQDTPSDEDDDDDYGNSRRRSRKKGRVPSRPSKRAEPGDFVAGQSGEDDDEASESESDFESSSTKKSRRAKKLKTTDFVAWEDDFPRYSTRTRNAPPKYNEPGSDDEDIFEDDEVDLADTWQEEEPGDVIDAFVDVREAGTADEEGKVNEETMYLVKWQGRSYRELCWCPLEHLRTCKGFKKIEKFIKEFNEREAILEDPTLPDEDKERVMLEINDRKDLLDEHKKVDRIIASRQGERTEENPSGSEYYVKWRGLGYEDSTWEAAATLTDDQGEIDAFLDRSNSQMVPSRSKQYRPDSRPPYKIFRSASDFLKGGELRDFQTLGVNWMADLWHRNMNGILADEMGLGKTVQTVSFLSYLFHKMHIYGPFLVVVPLGTISNWYRECAKWAPDMNVIVYQGNARGRDILRQEEFYSYVHCKGKAPKKILKFNVLLTTYEMVIMDKSHLSRIKWAFLAVDEAHRLKNDQSKLHQALAKEYTTGNRMLITGTPLQNNVQELLALIKFLMPAWKLDKDLEIDINDTESEEQQARIKELHGMLTQVMLRRLKKDVEQSLPGKTEMILRVPMSDLQKRYYTAIFTKNFKGLKAMKPDGTTSTSDVHISLQNVVMELKKVSNHPFLFPNARQFTSNRNDALAQLVVTSGKMALLDKLLTRMKAEGRRVLIFSQMVNMLNIMAEYLTMRGLHFQRLDGTVPSEARKRAMDHFNAPGSTDFAFLLSTRAGGLGLNLETADTVILFDLDWNPQNDLQAIARAHRIGQKRHVNVYRFVTAGSIEEDIVERAKRKMVLEYAIIQQMEKGVETKNMADELGKPTKDELATILKFGAKKLFEGDEPGSEPGQADEDKMAKLDLDDILARAEQTDLAQAQGVSGGSDEFMARWNTMNVEMDQLAWDEIVPESEVETRLKEAEALLGDAKKPEVPRKRLKVTGVSDSADEDASKEATKQDKKKSTKRKPPAERKVEPEDDPTEMDKKNISDLYGAIMTWGALDTRYDEMIQQAGLAHKSPDAIREAYEGILEACRVAVKEAGFDLANVKTPEKERAVYAEYQGVKELNGRKLLERIPLLQTLYDEMQAQRNILNYRIESSDLKTTAKWHSEPKWGMRDDAMLLVGTYRHGFGNYRAMQADSELGFQKKFFLGGERSAEKEDKKLPKKLHLDRRVISLLHSIRDQHLVSSPVRPKSKLKREREPEVEVRGPNKKRRSVGASERDNVRGVSPVRRKGTPTRSATNAKEKTVRQASPKNDRHSNHDPVLFKDYEGKLGTYKEMLRPVKTQLKACRDAPDFEKLYPPERQHKERVQWQLHTAQTQFKVVAELIESYVQEHRSRSARERLQAHLLRFVAENFFWKQPDGEPETWYNLKRLWEGIRSREVQEHNHKKVRSSPEVLSDIGGSPASSNTPSPKRKRDEDETLENKKPKREGSGSGGGGSGATPSGAGGAAAGKEGSKNGLTGYKIPKKKMVERP